MEFSYVAVDRTGIKHKGTIEANSEKEIADFLRTNALTPVSIKRRGGKTFSFLAFFSRVKNSDIVIFTRLLSSMILTGLTLVESLNILSKQTTNTQFRIIINHLISDISEGKSFSEALSAHRDIFSEVYISLIRAAESGGLLDKILARLAENLEKSDNLKRQIKGALMYPTIIVGGVVGVIAIMNIFVIPQLASLYENIGIELPLQTKIVIGMSHLFTNFWWMLIGIAIGGFVLYNWFKVTPPGERIFDKIKLIIPVFGALIELSILDEVSRTFSLLIRAGTPIIEALHITAAVAGNVYYKDAILSAAKLVEKGESLSSALENQNMFPPILIQLAKVGEETGKIDDNFEKVAEYFDRDLDLRTKTLAASIEPVLIVGLGIIIGFLILSIITPIYGIVSQFESFQQ